MAVSLRRPDPVPGVTPENERQAPEVKGAAGVT